MWTVVYLPAAAVERDRLEARERAALYNAVQKLEALGPDLGYPHSSAAKGTDRLREPTAACRAERFPRAVPAGRGRDSGRCNRARGLARPKGFARACGAAEARLGEIEE